MVQFSSEEVCTRTVERQTVLTGNMAQYLSHCARAIWWGVAASSSIWFGFGGMSKEGPNWSPNYNLEFNPKKSIIQFNWSHSTSIPGVTFNVVTLKMDGKMEIAEFMRLQTVLKKEKVRFGIVRRATQQTFLKKYKLSS